MALCKVHKVRKNTIIQDCKINGLKMVDFPSFITSLMSTWNKRLINTETKWIKFLESTLKFSINTIRQRGRDFSFTLIKRPINMFLLVGYK